MRSEDEIRNRLNALKQSHSDAITEDLSDESVKIAEHKIRQLKWVLEE